MFLDHATISIRAGRGGEGCVSFRRESYAPHGGPDGGDGGKGGDVIVEVDPNLATLLDFRYRREYHAVNGNKGSSSNKTGRSGDDLVLHVPPGTVLRDASTGESLGDLLNPGDRVVAARGGGGAGRATPTSRPPRTRPRGMRSRVRKVRRSRWSWSSS